ncbi:hypothetical protein ABPG75_008505 [Micractinium tetrahymenae]
MLPGGFWYPGGLVAGAPLTNVDPLQAQAQYALLPPAQQAAYLRELHAYQAAAYLQQQQQHYAGLVAQPAAAAPTSAAPGVRRADEPLFRAACSGNLFGLKVALEAGGDVHAVDSMGATALHWAARGGFVPVLQQLLEAGADLAAVDAAGSSVLHWAAVVASIQPFSCWCNRGRMCWRRTRPA